MDLRSLCYAKLESAIQRYQIDNENGQRLFSEFNVKREEELIPWVEDVIKHYGHELSQKLERSFHIEQIMQQKGVSREVAAAEYDFFS